MTAATPGQAAYEVAEAPFRVWMHEVGHDPDDMRTYYGVGALAEAFQGGTQAALAAREPHAAPGESSPLGLKHAVTSNRLGHALAALREIAEPSGDEFPRDAARNALGNDAAIRDNVVLTREPQPAPDVAARLRAVRADEFARVKVQLCLLVDSLDETVKRGSHAEEFDQGAAHASAVTARQLREILNDTALGTTPQPAPGLRAALEATLSDWRDDAVYRPTDTRDEITEHYAVTACADTLAAALAGHPDSVPQPAPELAGCECGHAQTGHAFSDDVCAVPECPCPGYRRTPQAAPELTLGELELSELTAFRHLAQPAPELAEVINTAAQAALARVLSWFAADGTRRGASATRAQLARAYADGGLTVPEELRRFL